MARSARLDSSDYHGSMRRNRKSNGPPPPDTVEQALAQSLQHARNSASEALMAARKLMDALSILLSDEPVIRHAEPDSPIGMLAQAIERWAGSVRGPEPSYPSPELGAILHALDAEITRWEKRANSDPEARTVLRAFLGMREILWEFNSPPRRGQTHASATRRKTTLESFRP
jgi:hypothetical protein